MKWFFIAFAFSLCAITYLKGEDKMESEPVPKYLYKILSIEDWKESQKSQKVKLPSEDSNFIHFSTEDQLDRILKKYWAHHQVYVILKVDTSKLPGKLVFESNPGGTTKYYHLYDGEIPMKAVVETEGPSCLG